MYIYFLINLSLIFKRGRQLLNLIEILPATIYFALSKKLCKSLF